MVVLDLDDTLFLERDYVRSGFKHIEKWAEVYLQVSGVGQVCWELFMEGVRANTFNLALEHLGIPTEADLISKMVSEYRGHSPSLHLRPDRMRSLEAISCHADLAVLTGGSPTSQEAKLDALGISALVTHVIYCGAWGPEYDKPHSRGWLELQRLTGLRGSEILYVADNPAKDWRASHKLGWSLIRVRMPESEHFGVPTPSGVQQIKDVCELPDILGVSWVTEQRVGEEPCERSRK